MKLFNLAFASVFFSLSFTAASAATVFSYDSLAETKSVEQGAPSPIRLNGGVAGAGLVENRFVFQATSTSMSLALGWLVAPAETRLVGVNLDLLDASANLIATDTFGGVTGAQANSTLIASGLTVGATYSLFLSGNALSNSRYAIDIVDGAVPPPAPSVPAGVPPASPLTFDTLRGSKVYTPFLTAGDMITLDGDIFGAGALANEFIVTATDGELSAGIGWLVTDDNSRLVGVNVDLFDIADSVVASDVFMGVAGSQAFSQLTATGLTPGVYRLVLTGTVIRDGRYTIDLLADDIAPGFRPIDVAAVVPLPAGVGLLVSGLLILGSTCRRTRRLAREG